MHQMKIQNILLSFFLLFVLSDAANLLFPITNCSTFLNYQEPNSYYLANDIDCNGFDVQPITKLQVDRYLDGKGFYINKNLFL